MYLRYKVEIATVLLIVKILENQGENGYPRL